MHRLRSNGMHLKSGGAPGTRRPSGGANRNLPRNYLSTLIRTSIFFPAKFNVDLTILNFPGRFCYYLDWRIEDVAT
jgi:hypothetical protein